MIEGIELNENNIQDYPAELIQSMLQRRNGTLLNLDKMLLHSIPVAVGWNTMLSELRSDKLSLSSKLRELVICAIGILNKADYEYHQHINLWIKEGASKEQICSLYHLRHSDIDVCFVKDVFDETELLCLELTKQMTLDIIQVDKDLKLNIQKLLGSTAFVELVTVISAYNMVSRFLVALDIPIESDSLPTTIN